MKAFKYVLGYLLVIQLVLPYMVPFDLIFRDRMDYNLVKDNLESIDVIIERIGQQIREENLQDYIIILGDSIAFSGPGNSGQSIGRYMQNLADQSNPNQPVRIYNLSMPAMQTGDIYTMLLKLDKYHVSTRNLIVNVDYQGFVQRNPNPAIVFWLGADLHTLDPSGYLQALPNLQANNSADQPSMPVMVHRFLWDQVEMFRYSGFIKKGLINIGRQIAGAQPRDDAIGDARPWFEKEGLKQYLSRAEYQRDFSDQAFDMSPHNPQILFLEKIIAHQQGTHTLVFMAAANQELMYEKVSTPGYVRNLQQVDAYLQSQPVQYVSMFGKIDSSLFSDHVHLAADGNRELARILWDEFEIGVNP